MNPTIESIVQAYPKLVNAKFHEIRSLILEVAESNDLGEIEETLKWGQPSFLCKSGSTIRLDWCGKEPNSLCVLFNCRTKLIETFREVFGDSLQYEGNRTIVLAVDEKTPEELEACILMALNYHKLKKLPLLGA